MEKKTQLIDNWFVDFFWVQGLINLSTHVQYAYQHKNADVMECVTHEFVASIFDISRHCFIQFLIIQVKNVCCLPFEDVKSLDLLFFFYFDKF